MLTFLALLPALQAAPPAGPWYTIETEHFRLHYPEAASAWAEDAGAQLESIHERVVEQVGASQDRVVDIVLEDPYTTANGYAIPQLSRPRMGIWASPPEANSVIGHYRSWEEDLLIHEDAHLVHLMIPSRNPLSRAVLGGLLGLGPISLKSPRWVSEGYATVVEGQLTGLGRPNADGRAQLIRGLAQAGRMPTYGELDGSPEWMGGSMAYLVGSAYLQWLEDRRGEGSLRDLWTAMSARQSRSFDEAFERVFDETPDVLYARFVAEITFDAMRLERSRPAVEGTIWQDLAWSTGAPAVSPDGEHVAVVTRGLMEPTRLVVWAAGDDPELAATWQEELDEILEKDPEDVTPTTPLALPREPEHERIRPDQVPYKPRWTPDGEAILFTSWMRGEDGRRIPDLVLWDLDGGNRRVTRGASIKDADPHPDGDRAIAVRSLWAASQLVEVDLASGDWSALTELDVNVVWDHPRVSPDGTQLAAVVNRTPEGAALGGWALVVRDLATGDEREVTPFPGAQVTAPAWTPDGAALIASVGREGFVELYRIPLDGSAPTPLTRTRGGAFQPAPTPDGEAVFFLSPDAEGFDLHRAEIASEGLPPVPAFAALEPVTRPDAPTPIAPPTEATVEPRPYRLGRPRANLVLGGGVGPGYDIGEYGLRLGDVAGRSTLMLLGAWSENGPRGGALRWGTHVWDVDTELHAFSLPTALREQGRTGLEASARWDRAWHQGGLALYGGGWVDQYAPRDGGLPELQIVGRRAAGALGGSIGQDVWLSRLWFGGSLSAHGLAGSTDGAALAAPGDPGWQTGRAEASLRLGWWLAWLEVEAELGGTNGSSILDRLALGGFDGTVYPDAWSRSQIFAPWLAPNVATGTGHDALSASLQTPGTMGISWRRDRISDSAAGGAVEAASMVGLVIDAPFPGQPIVFLSDGRLQMGAACIYEAPGEGVRTDACQEIDHYSAWLGVEWSP